MEKKKNSKSTEEEWDPERAQARGGLKMLVDLAFDVDIPACEAEFDEPKRKKRKAVKAVEIEETKGGKRGRLF